MKNKVFMSVDSSFLNNQLNDFIVSGKWLLAYELCDPDQLNVEIIKSLFLGELQWYGSTNDESGILIHKSTKKHKLMIQKSLIQSVYYYGLNKDIWVNNLINKNKQFKFLFDLIPDFINRFESQILEHFKYKTFDGDVCPNNAVITPNGQVYPVEYCGHDELYQILGHLNISTSCDKFEDTKCVHISSGSLVGDSERVFLESRFIELKLTKEQISVLFKYSNQLRCYSKFGNITQKLINYWSNSIHNYGSKFGNLDFIETFASKKLTQSLPNIQLIDLLNIEDKPKYCIRTSPKKSLPGVLDSYFGDMSKESIQKYICESSKLFIKYIKIQKRNKLNWFYQKFISGQTGVSNCYLDDITRSSIGLNQHSVVSGGKISSDICDILNVHLNKLIKNLKTFLNDNRLQFQIEWVWDQPKEKLTLVQFRFLSHNISQKESNLILSENQKSNLIISGTGFTNGQRKLKFEDILFVESDDDNSKIVKELLNKQVLIVNGSNEFLHCLALSSKLNIPSFYIKEKINLNNLKNKIKINKNMLFKVENNFGGLFYESS